MVEQHLQRLFQQQSAALAESFAGDGHGMDRGIRRMTGPGLKNAISHVPPMEKVLREEYLAGLRDAFDSLGESDLAGLAALYQRTVAFALLRQDPSIRRVKRRLAAQRILYLDTNVVMAWLLEDHPDHALASEVIELARSVGCSLRMKHFSQEEFDVQLAKARRIIARSSTTTRCWASLMTTCYAPSPTRGADADCRALQWSAFIGALRPVQAIDSARRASKTLGRASGARRTMMSALTTTSRRWGAAVKAAAVTQQDCAARRVEPVAGAAGSQEASARTRWAAASGWSPLTRRWRRPTASAHRRSRLLRGAGQLSRPATGATSSHPT